MRHLVRSTPLRCCGRNSQVPISSEAHEQKVRQWSNRLNSLSSTPVSKGYIGQLGALLNYYNRLAADTTEEIDWASWKSKIITEGLVDRVKQNYQEQNELEYDLDKLFNDVFSKDSRAIEEINNQMAFHTALWMDNYAQYLSFLHNLDQVSNINDYSSLEVIDMNRGAEQEADAMMETHSYLLGARDDINLFEFMSSQFAWGKKVVTFYRHPADDFMGGRATKNSMGR